MELTLTVHVPRRRPRPAEVVVSWAGTWSARGLADALAAHLGVDEAVLHVGGRALPPTAVVGRGALVHGASVTLVDATNATSAPSSDDSLTGAGVLELAVAGGPDAGHSVPLRPPGLVVGRSVPGGLSLDDPALSRRHADLRVDASGVVVTDEGSTNGVVVDGVRIEAPTVVDAGSRLRLGATSVRLRRSVPRGLPVLEEGDGRLRVRPATAAPEPLDDVVVSAPEPPPEPQRHRVPWVAALLPVPVALVLASFFGPQLLAFALLGPVLLLGTSLGDRIGSGRSHRRALERHATALAQARSVLEVALRTETDRLEARHPDPHVVLRTAEHRSPGLWARHDLVVRLGRGTVATRVGWSEAGSVSTPEATDSPVVVDLAATGPLHVLGPPRDVARALASVVGQLCVRCPPAVLGVAVADGADPDVWRWVSRLPHAAGDGAQPSVGVLVVPPDAPPDAVERATASLDPGWVVVSAAQPPPGATVLDLDRGLLTAPGRADVELVVDQVGAWWTDRLSRALAPLVDTTVEEDAAGLPVRVTLDELLRRTGPGGAPGSSVADLVTARWAGSAGRLRVPVGVGPAGVHEVDLVTEGPHALVGGTTGAGKSEFLRTLVGSLCATLPPDDLALVLVDFKGGASFGACADLPQVVGLLTDLDEHLVDRALTSLGAELRRRERLFAALGVPDLEAYRRVAVGPAATEPLPRLVVVVDEVKALLDTSPDFLHGLVRLAAQGRSLGVHLVLATQRPAGALSAEVQANITLRVAFRVRDRADSVDVIEDPAAAHLDPAVPGRALARGADGRLVGFQAAVVADPPEPVAPFLLLSEPTPRSTPERDVAPTSTEETGPPDAALAALVASVREAEARRGGDTTRRSPWPAPLPDHVPAPAAEDAPVPIALVDEPELQRVAPMTWPEARSTWLVCGTPGSGRSTAARAFALAATSTVPADSLHLHVVDAGGGLEDLTSLPHLGTYVGAGDRRALRALVDHLRAVEGGASPSGPPETLLLVDGWERLVATSPTAWGDELLDDLMTVVRDGTASGIRTVVTGDRSLLHPRWSALGARTLLLGAVDPLDAALTGLRACDLPSRPVPGRAVRVDDRRTLQVVACGPLDTERLAARSGSARGAHPWRHRPLPSEVEAPPVHAGRGRRAGLGLPVGLRSSAEGPVEWSWDPATDGRRLLVTGPPRSGRSTLLATIADAAGAAGFPVCVLAPHGSRPPRPERSSSQEVEARRWRLGPDDVDRFVELRRAHPSLAVLVDDVDRLDDSPLVPLLREHGELLDRDGGLLVVATGSGDPGRFRGLDVEVARHRLGIVLAPRTGDGELLRAGRLPDVPEHPGRGVLVGVPGAPVELQVYRSTG